MFVKREKVLRVGRKVRRKIQNEVEVFEILKVVVVVIVVFVFAFEEGRGR